MATKSLYAPMRIVLNTTVVEAGTLRDLRPEHWRVIAYRSFDESQWLYVEGLEVEAYENLRHANMFVLTQRRQNFADGIGEFVLLCKVRRDMEEAWPGVLKNELNKVKRR